MMKAEITRDLVYDFNNMFSLKTELLLRDVVIQYLDYFFPNAANNPSALIDNKIEQAMDLVKSHLMYTMREEVQVLKERIAELLERINKLEMENSFLKANASPEVLNALHARFATNQHGNNPSSAIASTN